jgi:cell division protein ZapA
MAEVTVTIAGRNYRMACDDGQEEHLLRLGDLVDQKIADMRASFGEIGDMRLTVMAAIVIADDLSEARNQAGTLRNADENALAAAERDAASAADSVNHLAERLEVLAADLRTRLKGAAGAPGD